MLRACRRGTRPECFPWDQFALAAWTGAAWQPPSSSREVLQFLRTQFQGRAANPPPDPFAVLRCAATAARALWPVSLPAQLPVFELAEHTLLVGERAQFVFFEPRYVLLVERALAAGGGGRFVHLPARRGNFEDASSDPVGVIATITEHQRLPDGRVVVAVMAGPRCKLIGEQEVETESGRPPLIVGGAEILLDDEPADSAANAALAARCLGLLLEAAQPCGPVGDKETAAPGVRALTAPLVRAAQQLITDPGGAPPLDTERLSFFLLQLLLSRNDARGRVAALYSKSTVQRLSFAAQLMEGPVRSTPAVWPQGAPSPLPHTHIQHACACAQSFQSQTSGQFGRCTLSEHLAPA